MEILVDESFSIAESLEFFKSHIEKFKPVKKITIFLDSENFIFTDYKIEQSNINMVIENWYGDLMLLKHFNCGYYGNSPGGTLDVLNILGVTDIVDFENRYLGFPGIELMFDIDGIIKKIIPSPKAILCHNRIREDNDILINRKYFRVNMKTRKIYLRNPQKINMKSLLILIDHCEFDSLEYWLGIDSPLEDLFRAEDYFEGVKQYNQYTFGADEVNLKLNGKRYSICCLVSKVDLIDLINCVWLYISGEKIVENSIRVIKDKFYFEKAGINFLNKFLFRVTVQLPDEYIYRKIESDKLPGDKKWLTF